MKKKYMMAACACMSCVLLGSGTYVYARPETSVTNHFSTGVVDINLDEYELTANGGEEPFRDYTGKKGENPLIMPGDDISKIPRITNRKKECDELIEACPDDYKLIKSALIGICYYAAVRMLKKTEQPVVGIVIKTTVRMKEDLNFLYKWVSEDMGPADTYCPDNILDELSEADSDWAKNWRAECRKCNERKQKLSAMPVGSEIKVTCNGFEYIMTKTVLPSHSTPQWINFEENFKFTVDDIVRSGFSCIDLEKSEENKMEHITKIWKYIFTFDKKGEITFESTGALECKECLKTIKLKDQISWESTLRKDKIGTVICNMPTEKDAFAHFTYYYVYLTEDNPRYAISLIQKKMEDRVDFLQKETSRLNLNIQTLNKKIILLNEEKLEEHDKN